MYEFDVVGAYDVGSTEFGSEGTAEACGRLLSPIRSFKKGFRGRLNGKRIFNYLSYIKTTENADGTTNVISFKVR